MTTIYLEKHLESGGYSGIKVFEDDFIYVSVGNTTTILAQRVIAIRFHEFDMDIYGGKEVAERWRRDVVLLSNLDRQEIMKEEGNSLSAFYVNGKDKADEIRLRQAANTFCFKLLFANLTPIVFLAILNRVKDKAKIEGRNQLRAELFGLLEQE